MDTIATTINGHSATTQKERFQSGFSGVGFLFMPLSQAFEDRYFTRREVSFGCLRAAHRTTFRDVRSGDCRLAEVLFRCDRRELLHDRSEARIIAQRIP